MAVRMPSERTRRVHILPMTPLGWWAVGLAGAAIVLVLAWQIMPFGALIGFGAGLAGGVLALIAIIRDRERALSVFAAVLPMLFVGFMVVAELLSAVGVLPEH